ncbi:LOW QUALITY PROTEIN: integrin alpha-2 [Chanos chanos]|uniref:LOW QUALITY PROTEIN: integrin alpha-2 n=1 Tax=Chanos chanos TaxID=29144 RepID=A0A6J2UWQ2_CHACN|nr:LOW QUALITY PROTEIN: integrin alpha-2-like [Chanos chanos]
MSEMFRAFDQSEAFNVGTTGAKVFSGPAVEEFGYTVKQFSNHQGKWLLVGAPWSGYKQNRKGDVYKCEIMGPGSSCERLNLQNSVNINTVNNINTNMSLGLTLTRTTKNDGFMTCGPLWAQQCGSQYFYPGVCAEVKPLFSPLPAFSPALQTCGGPMDIVIVLDGSNSIYPWNPVVTFLEKLLENLDIGPSNTQVCIIQYGVDPSFEFYLSSYKTKASIVEAASKIKQKQGLETNTFNAIEFARANAFLPSNGGRPGATKVMVGVTDGESHDQALRDKVIQECEKEKITRFGIAVLGYYLRNDIDTKNLIKEIKSIASVPTEKYFFNVSAEEVLFEIAGTLGDRIFNIEGTGKGGDFQMENVPSWFSAHQTSKEDVFMLGAVGAYGWSGTVVHQSAQKSEIFPKSAFEKILEDKNHSSLLGYSVTTLTDGSSEYFVAGAPRSNHTGQVIVYIINSQKQPVIIDSQRGHQIGSYFGSVLCPLDVDGNGVTDVLLVGAPMFMSDQKKETGKVYLFSITKGLLSAAGSLEGPSPSVDARFGFAISAMPDLNLDGFNDVVVGAPLEDNNHGIIYIYYGEKRTILKQSSQKIFASKLDPGLQYFGRSLDGSGDLNADTIPDISVGAYGKVIQLWSRGIAVVTAKMSFTPEKISVLNKPCSFGGRMVSCFKANICFRATFRPRTRAGPVEITYNLTLDKDLQSYRVSSRGQFINSERLSRKTFSVTTQEMCQEHEVYIQEAPDLVNPISLHVEVVQQRPDTNPVLDVLSPNAWEFFYSISKDCGTDELCRSDLSINVRRTDQQSSSSPLLVTYTKRLSLTVTVMNSKENAYNTRVSANFSNNLYYSSITPPVDGTEVKCTLTSESLTLYCQIGYPVLQMNQEVTFDVNFDFNLKETQKDAKVSFQVQSDSTEEIPSDNKVSMSIPLQYDSEIILTRDTNLNVYFLDEESSVKTTMTSFSDIGPEFNFIIKVSTGNFPMSLAYLTVSLPTKTKEGNSLLYVTAVNTEPVANVHCETSSLIDPLKIKERPYTASFSKENLRGTKELNCETAVCQQMKCTLKGLETKSDYFVNVTAWIWNGTFASADFQSVLLTVNAMVETSQPDLLLIKHNNQQVVVTISDPRAKRDVPIGIIVGSVIGGLLLLAAAVAVLWKVGFFKRKYTQLQKNAADDEETEGLQANTA